MNTKKKNKRMKFKIFFKKFIFKPSNKFFLNKNLYGLKMYSNMRVLDVDIKLDQGDDSIEKNVKDVFLNLFPNNDVSKLSLVKLNGGCTNHCKKKKIFLLTLLSKLNCFKINTTYSLMVLYC
eukprot:TRINITY_DN2624_c0_g1_i1.p1 TRINITY_DN2624_c0_g1~~TRINITY_DN2624_c0_g1_i1.p1  ORF type:complete len:122 (+),score=14.84 TRINITY_DN2624_c0_g1_i1:121-486(+)